MQKCPLYGDVCFIESPYKNHNSSRVNIKSTISHDFPSPDLLERPKDGKMKEDANFFLKFSIQASFTTLVHLNNDQEVHIIYNQ